MIYDSVLSEFAALGFEYGYSVADRDALVCWEAQFGDFGNGAQTIIDQFIVAAEDKWGQRSGLVLLLPHGFEGQGPEHSSARLERFLVLCAEDNIRVVYPTTAAQYFHVLRRQVHDPTRKPLIVMTPKRYLRMPVDRLARRRRSPTAASSLVLDDPATRPRHRARAGLLQRASSATSCIARRDEMQAPVAIVRIEQLYPWPEREIAEQLARYPNAEVVWAQEEPGNMGARYFARRRIEEMRDGRHRRRRRPRPRARARRRAARRSTTPSSRRCSKRPSPRPERMTRGARIVLAVLAVLVLALVVVVAVLVELAGEGDTTATKRVPPEEMKRFDTTVVLPRGRRRSPSPRSRIT